MINIKGTIQFQNNYCKAIIDAKTLDGSIHNGKTVYHIVNDFKPMDFKDNLIRNTYYSYESGLYALAVLHGDNLLHFGEYCFYDQEDYERAWTSLESKLKKKNTQ